MNSELYESIDQIRFVLNGAHITVNTRTITPQTTLNELLRKTFNLTGTKYMCMQGGCGSCIVSVRFKNPITNTKETKAVNSCLVHVLMINCWEITTIEGLGNRVDGYNEIQQRVVQFNATQCGFCTPGMIMNMYALQRSGTTKMADIEDSFGGNLCRCTGYRPLLTAFKSLASDYDETVLGLVHDIEDLDLKLCSKTKRRCLLDPPQLGGVSSSIQIAITSHTSTGDWYTVFTVPNIFAIFRMNPTKSYQLVDGNTAQGIYKDIGNRNIYIDISAVKELKNYSHDTTRLTLGANMTLQDVIHVCRQVAQSDDAFAHLLKVAAHIELVGNIPVRNMGTLAGNLSIKYLHNEFPSDIFLLLETIGANLVICDGSQQKTLAPSQYLDFDMDHKIILRFEIPPLHDNFRFETYKIMKRAQNSYAIINAGFFFQLRNNDVQMCRIVYGGVNPTFIHAKKTEAIIRGNTLFDNNNMQKFFAQLLSEIQPDNVLSEPSPEFRKKLCASLLYKFILSVAPDGLVSTSNKSGGEKLIRSPVSRGVQDYKTNQSMYPIGEPMHKLEAADQASGQAKYITDYEDSYGQCFAFFVEGKAAPGSTLKSIDASDALALDGVEGFFEASDIPGENSFMIPVPALEIEDEEIFLAIGDKLKYYSQPVGIIVANAQRTAETAASLVIATFIPTTTRPVLTTKDAMDHPERIFPINTWLPKKQNIDVPVKFKGVFESGPQYHNHMELQVVSVHPDDNGDINVDIATQWMDAVQSSVSRSMDIPAHKIHITVKRMGGGFGARITRASLLACAATLAVIKLRKPVKLFMSLEANMNVIGKRHAIRSIYEVGVDNDGVIGYLNNQIYSNTGCSRNSPIELFIFDLYEGPYVADTFHTEIDFLKTDIPAATYARAPGGMEGSAIIETILDHIACKVNKDPIDVRLANLKDDDLLKKVINEALKWSDYRSRRQEIEKFNQKNVWRKRGISLVPMLFTLTGYAPYYGQVSIFQSDGTVAIIHGGTECGQGINTKVAQVAAYTLGVSIGLIRIWATNNFVAPNNFATGANVTSESICISVQTACAHLKARIEQAAKEKDLPAEASWLAKVQNAQASGLSLSENGEYAHDQTNPTFYQVYGACVSEIEMDVLTGQMIVQRADIVEDTGFALNPYIDIGQVEGAFIMGCGHWTCEEIIVDDNGALKTNSTWNYKIPGAKDIPVDFRVKFPDGRPNPLSPFKNKATGEPPLCLAFTVPLAIEHALQSIRTQFDEELDPWATMEGPCSIEWIFMNSAHNIKQYQL